MPGATIRVARGTTFGWGTSTVSVLIKSIRHTGVAAEPAVDVTHMGTANVGAKKIGNKTKKAIGLVDGGQFVIQGFLNPDVEPPVKGVEETNTLTFPTITGDSTATIWTFTGSGASFEMGAEHNGVYECTITVDVLSEISITDAT